MVRSLILSLLLVACRTGQPDPIVVKAGTYEAELVACNQTAKTFEESVDCENKVRSRYGRPQRDTK